MLSLHGFRYMNGISILFDHDEIGINSFVSIIDGIKKFANDVYDSLYDIGGFNVYILY